MNDAQRAFLPEGFARARDLATFGEIYTTQNQSPNKYKLFDWLFFNGPLNRRFVLCAFLY